MYVSEFQVSELFTLASADSKGTAFGLQDGCYITLGHMMSRIPLSLVLFGRGGAGGPSVLMFVLGAM